jgi:uncharacterized protein with PIN domain
MGDTKPARRRTIELLCQECHGTLAATSRTIEMRDGDYPVWICAECRRTFVYTQRGWVRQDY